jgi:hypothetical protein
VITSRETSQFQEVSCYVPSQLKSTTDQNILYGEMAILRSVPAFLPELINTQGERHQEMQDTQQKKEQGNIMLNLTLLNT